MTASIRGMQEQLDKFPRNVKLKVALKELIDKRKKFLKYLRRWDYRRFEWMLEKLDLVYKPPPTEFHWVTRRESLQKLTDAHCEQIKEDRLAEYRKVLNEKKKKGKRGKGQGGKEGRAGEERGRAGEGEGGRTRRIMAVTEGDVGIAGTCPRAQRASGAERGLATSSGNVPGLA